MYFMMRPAGTWSEDTLKKNIRSTFRELAGIFFKISVMNVEEKEEGIIPTGSNSRYRVFMAGHKDVIG